MFITKLFPSSSGSRVGRRLFLLFVVCSLVPMTALAVLSYATVTRQLRKGSLDRLEQTGRVLAGTFGNRLRFLDDDLKQVTQLSPCTLAKSRGKDSACDGSLRYGLTALSFVSESGAPIRFFGRMDRVPALTLLERQELEAGRAVVLARTVEGRPAVYFTRMVEDGRGQSGMLVGQIYADYLWQDSEQNPLIPTMQLHVVDESNQLLFRSIPTDAPPPPSIGSGSSRPAAGTFEWRLGDEPYLAAYSVIAQPPGIATPGWKLIVSEAQAAVMAPMAGFRRTFPIVALLSLAAALLLSLSQLRRQLAPLVALQEGTRRLARQQFDQPVTVSSGDEFGELAESFNAMADKIAGHFTALVAAAETDRAVLSSVDTTRIVETVLSRMRDICRCDSVAVLLVDADETTSATLYLQPGDASAGARARPVRLAPLDAQRLRQEPEGFTPEAGSPPEYLSPLTQEGGGSILVLPLAYQSELLGAIALGGQAIGWGEDELLQVRRVAGQVALALANARMVEQIRFLAFYDNLTGLPNRVSFRRRLATQLAQSLEAGSMFAVCFLDLDHFSRINDTLGHKFGDRLLQLVGTKIKSCCLSAAPSASVSRLGGDEFTVILPDLTDPRFSAEVARNILDSFNTPFSLDGHEVFVSASVGVAIFPTDGTDVESLLKNADAAMYQAKRNGRNTFEFFAKSMSTSAVNRLTLESHLRKAIDGKQFEIWYQPVIDVRTGRVASAEALIRWHHPGWGIVLPGEFIPLCEETGLIVPLGEWILRSVCSQNEAWQLQGLPPIPIAVNLSGQQLRGGAVVELVRDALGQANLDPRYLILELTESILMENEGGATAALPALAELGIGLAIDDFGTGYSSLSYLKHFPVDTVKIDKSFVCDVTSNPNDAAITSAIIAMGHALDLRVVGEGVETAEQAELLRLQGCDLIQGFWVSRPIPAKAFGTYLREDATTPARRLVLEPGESRRKRRLSRRLG